MAAYIIVEVEVTDPATYDTYRAQAPAVVARFGGEFIVRGGEVRPLEGDWQPSRVVVLRFPDLDSAQRFYDSAAYQEIIGIRKRAAHSRAIMVDGV